MPSHHELNQSVSNNRLTILVGAGHSQALGFVGTDQITRAVDAALVEIGGDEYLALREALHERLGPLVTFEHIASALEIHLLLDQSRYFASDDGTVSYLGYDTIAPAVIATKHPMMLRSARDLYGRLMRTVVDLTDVPVDETTDRFANASAFYQTLMSLIQPDIATLNYDQILEQLFPDVVDGFVRSEKDVRIRAPRRFLSREFLAIDGRIRLAHLHGSTRWGLWDDAIYRLDPSTSAGPLRWDLRSDGVVATTMVTGDYKPAKLVTAPYNHYYHWLAQRLYESPRLLIVGYGAGDQHLNAAVHTWATHHGEAARMVLIDKYDGGPPLAVRALAMFALGETHMDPFALRHEMFSPFRRVWASGNGFPPDRSDTDAICDFLKY